MDEQSRCVIKTRKGLYWFILLSMMSLCDASSMKKPLKSIKSPDGDIIDCIHISHQPAFDHPLLKNQTILMQPSYYPAGKGLLGESDTETITQLWQLNGKCPEGTIPIRRNQNKSIIKRYAKKKHKSFPQISLDDRKLDVTTGHEHAFAYVGNNKFYGAKATINLWRPQVQNPNEFSLSQIWIIGGSQSSMNTIEAGWMVFPQLFGDNETRLFAYWTSDDYQTTGCYNLRCSGFVQTTNRMALGGTISPVSTYQGAQLEISLLIWKDPAQNVWWLKYGNDDVIGYWPASIFTSLADSASLVEWGGEVFANSAVDGQHTTTQMGSGHFAEEKFGGSSYFKNLQVVDESNTLRPTNDIKAIAEKPNCYNIELAKSDDWGDFFYYGGPGKNDNCP